MVPSSSTSITLLLGDCFDGCTTGKQKFTKERFKIYHPGGNIGKTLLLVKDIMLTGNKIPLINFNNNIVSAVKIISKKKFRDRIIVKNKKAVGIVDGDMMGNKKLFKKN